MDSVAETAEVAVYLRRLKARSNLSYKTLAHRAGAASSTLHRYCSGEQFPADFRVVQSFATACGATTDELRCLRRLWATDQRNPAVTAGTASPFPSGLEVGTSSAAGAADVPAARSVESTENGSAPSALPAEHAPTYGPTPAVAVTAPAVEGVTPATPAPSEDDGVPASGEPRSRRIWAIAASLTVVAVLALAIILVNSRDEPDRAVTPRRSGLLFSAACEGPVAMGQHDSCVLEVQRLLARTGAKIGIDADFGPETLRRVTAFQVLAGVPVRGIVDDDTKRALYEGGVSMRSWTPAQVVKRIREVFPEEPDRAVAIAKCQSMLDPLWVLPNVDTSRNWGLFQISDRRLRELGGTPRRAFDPNWNILAARELWRIHGGFTTDWPYCDGAFPRPPTPKPSD